MKLPTLYSRTQTGAVQTWTIEVDNGKYRTTYGQVDGAKTTTEWTVCGYTNMGKSNERNPMEQAIAEAQALHDKRLESGYFESIEDIDNEYFIEPMLAKDFNDYKDDIKRPVYSQPKLDGIRCLHTGDIMQSRKGKTFVGAPHITEALKDFFKKFPGYVLDGELYCDKFNNDFPKISSIVKKQKHTPAQLKESAEVLQYWVYDVITPDGITTFGQRNAFLKKNLPKHPSIVLVDTDQVSIGLELDKLYEQYVDNGYEGQMVRLDEAYEHKRTSSLLKRKEFITAEYTILDVCEGIGNKTGMAGYMVLAIESKKKDTFRSNIKGNRAYLKQLLKDRNALLGLQATVKYFHLSPDGVPRFPYVIGIRDYE